MERILWLYALPYDPDYPVVCMDERPCFLIGNEVEPISMATGKVAKEHYSYTKNGSCNLFAAIEPLTGERVAEVYKQRTMKEFTHFAQIIAKAYPEARKIRLVLDNLSTHGQSAFYKHLPADEAIKLAQRFEFIFTPKRASWLNMIEIEFSALSRQCLNRRIPTQEQLESEVLALINDRSQRAIKINWMFDIDTARVRLNSKYLAVNESNIKFNTHENF